MVETPAPRKDDTLHASNPALSKAHPDNSYARPRFHRSQDPMGGFKVSGGVVEEFGVGSVFRLHRPESSGVGGVQDSGLTTKERSKELWHRRLSAGLNLARARVASKQICRGIRTNPWLWRLRAMWTERQLLVSRNLLLIIKEREVLIARTCL